MKYKYILDKENLVYKKISLKRVDLIRRHYVKIIVGLTLGFITWTLSYFGVFESVGYHLLNKKTATLISDIHSLNDRFDSINNQLKIVRQRDKGFYRIVSQLDPISENIRHQGFGGINDYADLEEYQSAELLIKSNRRSDILIKQLQFQKKSLDTLFVSVLKLNDSLLSMPAILPVSPFGYHRLSSPFGVRVHPITGKKKMHDGVDFAGNIGKPVYATGNGVVITAQNSSTGYGNRIKIEHGFGYQTLYAHLQNILVEKGDTVYRGQQIATVGNSGISTGPHLHYEVIVNQYKKDPQKFYVNDLSAEEFKSMLKVNN